MVGELLGAFATVGPVRAQERLCSHALGSLLDFRDFRVCVGDEFVDRDNSRNAELVDVLDVALQVVATFRDSGGVLSLQIILGDTAVHLQSADRRDDDDGGRCDAGLAALDVEEFLGAEVGTEAGFRHHVIGKLQSRFRRQHRIATMRDVGERPAVDEDGIVLERLHEVRRQRILQQNRHGAVTFQLAGADRLLVSRIGDDDVAEAVLEVLQIFRQAEDGHHFRGDRDVEAVLARKAVRDAAERVHDRAERAIVHVEHALPADAALVDAKRIAPIDMIVDQRREQVVGARDGVEVAGEVQVDVFHRHDLGVAAARRAAFDAEAGAERRLAKCRSWPSCRCGSGRRRGRP